MRLLTNVSNMTDIKNVPSVAKANELMHSVGLGVMNLHGHLVRKESTMARRNPLHLLIIYGSMNYFSLKSSMEIAKEKKKHFMDLRKVIMRMATISISIRKQSRR